MKPFSLALRSPPPKMAVRLVGKHCETGDILIPEAWVPGDLTLGEIMCTPVTGAYGHSMASNYDKVLRPAVLSVNDGKARFAVFAKKRMRAYYVSISSWAVLGRSTGGVGNDSGGGPMRP